jgi:hypothetical protein
MMKEFLDRTETFPIELKPISIQIKKYLDNNSNIDELVINVLHRPWIARLNWGLMLYKEVKREWFSEFKKRTGKEIPDFYKDFLKHINGGFIYGISMYGLTPSFFETGLLNRTILQCHNLATANIQWIAEYKVDMDLFHFASRNYSNDENVGYFWKDDIILCYRKSGELLKQWNSLEEMLYEEIDIAEERMLSEIPKEIVININ